MTWEHSHLYLWKSLWKIGIIFTLNIWKDSQPIWAWSLFFSFFLFFFGRKAFSYTFIFFYNLKNTQIYLSLSILLTSQSINLALLSLLYVCFLFHSFLFLSLFPSLCVKIFNDESEFKFYQLCFISFETMLTGTQKFKIVMSLCWMDLCSSFSHNISFLRVYFVWY